MPKTSKTKRKNAQGWRTKIFLNSWKKILIIFLLLFGLFLFIFRDLPSPTKLSSTSMPVSTQIMDRNGKLLFDIYLERNRIPVKLAELPPYVPQSAIAIEDKDFYRHHGWSTRGIGRALFSIAFRQRLQGGSTITQQLVKTALLSPERTIQRKLKEFLLSLATEIIYSKDQILEMYLNQVPYGGISWGIEVASQTYFNKSAKDLTLAEAALLAGLPASPTRYSPFGAHPELAKGRQELVLEEMVKEGYLSQTEAEAAKKEELKFVPQTNSLKAPHFVMYVKEQLVEKYGLPKVEQGGLKVTTTLDLELQEFAQETVATEVAKLKNAKVGNGAALVTNPKTGEILAMVGSKDYFNQEEQGNFNVTTALRQPGSAIKPINYALGLSTGKITAATPFNDLPTCFNVPDQPLYCPSNYDGTFRGPTQVRFALGNSINIPAVDVLALNGLDEFVATASAMGLTTLKDPSQYGLSLTLGGGEVKMTEMATAYGVFANNGLKQNLVSILKVEDYLGKTLEQTEFGEGERVLSMEVAYLISHILLDNNARSGAFGSSSYLVVPGHPEVSVKTGTTNDKRDNWTVGYTADLLTAVWVGNNDNTPMAAVASGVTGASPIWNRIIRYALNQKDLAKYLEKTGKTKEEAGEITPPPVQNWPLAPEGIVGLSVCNLSGLLPPDEGCDQRFEYFLKDFLPSEKQNLKKTILINKDTGQVVQNGETQPPNVEFQEHPVIIDPLGTIFCLDCPVPTEPVKIKAIPASSKTKTGQN